MVSIDGTDITDVTIDGDIVTEITVDGDVVWPNGLTEIANYIEDDWGDNSLTNRSSTSDGVYAHPDANEAGDVLIGRYRPEWKVEGDPSVQVGSFTLDYNDEIRITSNLTVGEWKFDGKLSSTVNSTSEDKREINFIFQDYNNRYFIGWETDTRTAEESFLRKTVSDSRSQLLDLADSLTDTNQHTVNVTRDSYNGLEVVVDGSSKGTITDSFLPTQNYFVFGNNSTDSNTPAITYSNLVIQ